MEGQRPVFLFLQRWTVFVIETLSPQNFGNYFSVRITMYFSFLHSVQKQSHTFIGNSGKVSHFPLDNPYFNAVKLYWKVREQVRRGALKCARDCPSHNCNLFQTDVRMTPLVQRRERQLQRAESAPPVRYAQRTHCHRRGAAPRHGSGGSGLPGRDAPAGDRASGRSPPRRVLRTA